MPTLSANGIELFYDEHGAADGDPLLLVMGFTAQMTAWPDDFVAELADRGFRVIRFDNRDTGLSTHLDGVAVDLPALFAGTGTAPYKLTDMAADAVGVLDALDIPSAHIVGASMGGMIVQTIAIEHADRVKSLVSIMSTTGNSSVGQAEPAAMAALMSPPPADREGVMARSVETSKIIGSKTYPLPEDEARERASAAYDRAFYPEGATRQLAAILTSPDRTEALGGVTVPTLVIHGLEDSLIVASGGRATHAAIPGSTLLEVAGMGHDLPRQVWPEIFDAIAKNAAQAVA